MSEQKEITEIAVDDGFLGAQIVIEDRSFGGTYPICQWVNGSPTLKSAGGVSYTGGFFISADQQLDPEVLKGLGFEPFTLVTKEAQEVPGYATRDLTFSPIRIRRAWSVNPGGGELSQMFGQDEYDEAVVLGRPRGVCHVLVGLKGLDEPIMISFRGLTAREMMGQGKERGVIPSYGTKIIGAAKRIARAAKKVAVNYPLCAFQLTVGPEMESDKKPKFTEVGTSDKQLVTNPYWKDEPAQVDQPLLQRLFVGSERLASHQDWFGGSDEWFHAFDSENLSARRNSRKKTPIGGASAPADTGVPAGNEISF